MSIRVRKPALERREEIARAVLRIIGERGLTSLTTTAIAEEIGVTSGALFRHFESREAILQEAVRYALLKIEETFPDRSRPPLERLLQLANNRVQVLGSDPGLAWLLGSDQAYLALPDGAVEQLRGLVKRSKQYLLDALREGASQGSIRNDIEPEDLLVPVMGTIHALIGMNGVHRLAKDSGHPGQDSVLSALEKMLAPVEESTGKTKKGSQ